MDWSLYLSSAVRLIDLHDCKKQTDTSTYSPPENRNNTDGFWVSIAINLLQYLYEKSLEKGSAWVEIEGIIEDTEAEYSISKEAVIFVLNFMSTPTTLTVNDNTNKLETTLVEFPRNTHAKSRCRLTQNGIRAVKLVQASSKWVFAGNDAQKILTAIELSFFDEIPELIKQLDVQLLEFLRELQKTIERYDLDFSLFLKNKTQYQDIINSVQQSVAVAKSKLSDHTTNDIVSEEKLHLFQYIDHLLDELLKRIVLLNRRYSEAIEIFSNRERQNTNTMSFEELAIGMAKSPSLLSKYSLENIIRLTGPWKNTVCAPIEMDFQGILKNNFAPITDERIDFSIDNTNPVKSKFDAFIEKYKSVILEALDDEGELSLTMCIEYGWFELDNVEMLPQLIGLYTFPQELSSTIKFAVCFKQNNLSVSLPSGKKLFGDDVVLLKVE